MNSMERKRGMRAIHRRRAYVGLFLPVLLVVLLGIACVPHPTGPVARERLVAAGKLKGDMKQRTNVVNDLHIVKVSGGQVVVSFPGYRMPDKSGEPKYLVRTSVCKIGGMVVPAASVGAYTTDGIVLHVTDPEGKMPLPLKFLVEHEFTIEVNELPSR